MQRDNEQPQVSGQMKVVLQYAHKFAGYVGRGVAVDAHKKDEETR
jgi:hypothetical protein